MRQQPRPAPPGHQSEKDLRQGESRRTGVEGAVIAVQGQFESTAHGGAVHECERGDGELAESTEDVVAELGELFDDAGVGDDSDG